MELQGTRKLFEIKNVIAKIKKISPKDWIMNTKIELVIKKVKSGKFKECKTKKQAKKKGELAETWKVSLGGLSTPPLTAITLDKFA